MNRSTIIRHLRGQSSADCQIIYYFCDSRDPESRSARKVVESLIASLCRSSQSALDYVEEHSRNFRQNRSKCSIQVLSNLFKYSLALESKTYVVIDGVDECMEQEDLTRQLTSFLDGQLPINLFLTSRREPNIARLIESSPMQQCTIEPTNFDEDVSKYVSNRLDGSVEMNELRLRKSQYPEGIQEMIRSKANGV